MSVVAYLAGIATLPFGVLLYQSGRWAFAKDTGVGECQVAGCKRAGLEIGKHFNLTVWLFSKWHEAIVDRPGTAHRRQVVDFWRGMHAKGYPVHPRAKRWLDQ